VLATTHHDRLKTYASATPGVVNAAVEFDDVNLRPTYRFDGGRAGRVERDRDREAAGIATGIIERARSLLTPESREAADLIAYLHRSRDELDRMQRQMATERMRWRKNARSCEQSGSNGSRSGSRNWKRSSRRCRSALTRMLRAQLSSFTASTMRAHSRQTLLHLRELRSSSLIRFCCRSTHSVRSFCVLPPAHAARVAICRCMRSSSSRLRCK